MLLGQERQPCFWFVLPFSLCAEAAFVLMGQLAYLYYMLFISQEQGARSERIVKRESAGAAGGQAVQNSFRGGAKGFVPGGEGEQGGTGAVVLQQEAVESEGQRGGKGGINPKRGQGQANLAAPVNPR